MTHESVLDETTAAIERGDWAAFQAAFTDDAVLKSNLGPEQHIDEAMKTMPLLTAGGTTVRFENVRRFFGPNSATEMHDAVFTKPDGQVVRIDICLVVQFNDDGKVIRSDEYMDSAAAAGLRDSSS